MGDQQEKSQEEMVKEAVEEAKKADSKAAKDAEEETAKDAGETQESADGASEAESEECGASEEEADGSAEGSKGGKKFFGKKNKKDKKDEKIEELTDRLTRQMAEFDNFRKRTDREKSQMYEVGAKDIIEKILPVVDNFERGLASISEEEKGNGFADGMQMIYKQLMTELENLGVKPIEAVGQEFNPDYHNAVMQVESEEYESGIVAQELQKGYMYRESVVRHSMVAVVQ